MAYRDFGRNLDEKIEPVAVELPGRGRRFNEPLLGDMRAMALDVLEQMRPYLNEPYALFGHSMGACLGYVLAQEIRTLGLEEPCHFFVSGRRGAAAPAPKGQEARHLLSREELYALLRRFGGCPPEILDNGELMELFEPIIRADFQAHDTFSYRTFAPLQMPITALMGALDPETPRAAVEEWGRETSGAFKVHTFPGCHFFLFEHSIEVSALIARQLVAASELEVHG